MGDDKRSARNRRYREKHWRRGLWYHARDRARTDGITFTVTRKHVEEIAGVGRCCYCGAHTVRGYGRQHALSPSLDRVLPERGYIEGNVVLACQRCNTMKGGATREETRRFLAVMDNVAASLEEGTQ